MIEIGTTLGFTICFVTAALVIVIFMLAYLGLQRIANGG